MTKTTKKKAPTPAFALLLKELKKNNKATFASIKAKAEKKGLTVFPVSYGRAQLALGIVKRGKGKVAAQKKAAEKRQTVETSAPAAKPRRLAKPVHASVGLDSILEGVRELQGEREALTAALRDIRGIIDNVLADA